MIKHLFKTALSLFGKLLIAKFFAFVLSVTLLMALSGLIGSILTQFCAFMLVVVLLYSSAWEIGDKDANMASIGRRKRDALLGLKAGLIAAVPDLALGIMLLLSKGGAISERFSVLYSLLNCNYLPLQQALLPPTLTAAEQSWAGYVIMALTALIAPMCAAFGYALGLNRTSISEILFYHTPESRARHEERLKARRQKRRFHA